MTKRHQAPDAPRTPRYFALSDKRLRWSLATASVLAIVALGLYWLGTGDAGTSQPRPTTVPSTESALQLNAVLSAGGKPLPSGVGYDVYEAAKDADGKRKPVTQSSGLSDPRDSRCRRAATTSPQRTGAHPPARSWVSARQE